MRPALLALLLFASQAFADRREMYVLFEAGGGLRVQKDPATATQQGVGIGPEGQLHVFYGVTNSLHVGGWARGFWVPDMAFAGVTPTLADGSRPTGTLYANAHGFAGGALARWRFDTGFPLAPWVQLELGLGWQRFSLQELIPTGRDFGIGLRMRDEVSAEGRLAAGIEYRLFERLLLQLLVGVRRSLGAVAQWQFDLSLAAGVVF